MFITSVTDDWLCGGRGISGVIRQAARALPGTVSGLVAAAKASLCWAALAVAVIGVPLPAWAGAQSYTGAGPDAASIASVLTAFRSDLGGKNNGVATNETVLTEGRREINWDAAALPENMPADFFNRVSKRGALFGAAVGFVVSRNTNAGPDGLFGQINPEYASQFTTNSPNRLFVAWGSAEYDVQFFVPGQPTLPATVSAFGAVFTDVELEHQSRIEFYDSDDQLLHTEYVPVSGNAGLSFAGARFDGGERIARIRVVAGNHALGRLGLDSETIDVVAIDDLIYSEPLHVPVVRTEAGPDTAAIAGGVSVFRTALGPNNGANTNDTVHSGGRREINWDAAALPADMPADFFNSTSKRGVVFSTPGTGFQVSVNAADGPDRRFGNVDPDYPNQFTTHSSNRLFAAVGSTAVEVRFFVPGQPGVPATVTAFGAVFTDIERANDTKIECYDLEDRLLGTAFAPVSGNAGLAFLSLQFPTGERVFRVRIVSGSKPLAAGAQDGPDGDLVVMDDFIYAEPQAAPLVRKAAGTQASELAEALNGFRAELGANNGVSTNDAVFLSGRREINWDAAALPVDMPADFFNSKSKRGAVFSTPGTGFQVSANTNAGPERLFGNLQADYATQFTTNSANRLFAAAGSTRVDVQFFLPGQPTMPATVHAFGAVFTDVEEPGVTKLEFFDPANQLLATLFAPVSGPGGLAFVGASMQNGERIARVRLTSGNLSLGATSFDGGGNDVVVMDDFIYAEPLAFALKAPAVQSDGTVLVTLSGPAGVRFTVQRSDDLGGWSDLGTATTPAPVSDAEAAHSPTRFYRALVK